MNIYFFTFILCITLPCSARQFVYPVADIHGQDQVFLLYQKSLYDLELWMWDSQKLFALKCLSTFHTPAHVKILPSKKGFSFIDQGYIKIKEFSKRSAMTIPIYEPIGLFSHVNWIDDEHFYFVALQGDFFQIFHSTIEGEIKALTYDSADALFPCKIENDFFYIKRTLDNQILIMRENWNLTAQASDTSEVIYGPTSRQLSFLSMLSPKEGIFLEVPSEKVKNIQDCYELHCYRLYQTSTTWNTEKLYTFHIPADYVSGSDRLYESIQPFLPRYYNGSLYFSDWIHNNKAFQVYKYNMLTKSIESITMPATYRKDNELIFSPYVHNQTIICGCIIDEKTSNYALQKNFEYYDYVYLELPTCSA